MSAPALHHNPFASRSLPAIATALRPHSSMSRSATLNHDQACDGHRAGLPLSCDRHASARLGWFIISSNAFSNRFHKAGVEDRVAAQILTNHSGAQSHFQCLSERHHSHFRNAFRKSPRRPDHHGRSENGWRHQILVMRYPT